MKWDDSPIELVGADDALWDGPRDPDLYRRQRRTRETVTTIIQHTTGYGAHLAGLERLHPDQLDLAFARWQGKNLKYKPHLLIGRTGRVFQFAPLRIVAWHTGHRDWEGLSPIGQVRWGPWWAARYPALTSPLDLPAWAPVDGRRSPNTRSVGIDWLAPRPGEPYTTEQYEAGAALVDWLCTELAIPRDCRHVVTHSEVHPIDRTRAGKPWDFDERWDAARFWAGVLTRVCSGP